MQYCFVEAVFEDIIKTSPVFYIYSLAVNLKQRCKHISDRLYLCFCWLDGQKPNEASITINELFPNVL